MQDPRVPVTLLTGFLGAGKTTFANLVLRFYDVADGCVRIDGLDVSQISKEDLRRQIALVSQEAILFSDTIANNIRLGNPDASDADIEQAARMAHAHDFIEALEDGYETLVGERGSRLSGGQRQRVALARAIVAGQPLCLMDEPLSNLDAKLRNSVRKDIKKLQRDLGITVVYVTHDQTEAMSMADTVVLMKDGHIEQVGAPEDLYNKPNNTFVAEFVGAPPMALIKSEGLDGFGAGQTLGIRAENIQIVPKGEGRMSCTITESEFLGSETLIGLDHGHATGLCVLKSGMALMPEGHEIDITFNNDSLHVFDAAGKRMAAQG